MRKKINDGIKASTSGLFSDYLSLMLGKPRIRQNKLNTSLRFPCLGLNPIIDSINLSDRKATITLLIVCNALYCNVNADESSAIPKGGEKQSQEEEDCLSL